MDQMTEKEAAFWKGQGERGIRLNEVQRQAVMHTDGPLLLLASPGSGKTTTIVMKIAWLLEVKGVHPSRIKAVTFSRAAALEMKERFRQFFPSLEPVDFSTLHSLAFAVMRERFRKLKQGYQLIEGGGQPDKRQILREIYKELVRETLTEDQMDELTTYISFIKNKQIAKKDWAAVDCSVPEAAEILERYEEYKASGERLLLDYDDMLVYGDAALAQDEELLACYQGMYDYVLTDESQDTSLVQHRIVEKLVRPHRRLCVVADDDQSIYSWRGAEPGYLLDFKAVYPQAAILFMEENYRSSRDIVEAANSFIKRNRMRYAKNMHTANPPREPVVIHRLNQYKEQAKYLVAQLGRIGQGERAAVLYRNNGSSVVLVNALDRAGISFYLRDGDKGFFSHWVVEDIMNFMRLTYSDKRTDIFEKIFTKINGYITRQQMEAVKAIRNNESVFDNLLQQVPLQDYQVSLIEGSKGLIQGMKGMAPLAAIWTIRSELGYEKALERLCGGQGFRRETLLGVLDTLEEIAAGLGTMEAFARRLKYLETIMGEAKNNRDSPVVLSTFHGAKGLEFDRVYMVDLLEGIIPSWRDMERQGEGKPADMEEAARLFYVGMTRAKTHLELVVYQRRDREVLSESRFVSEVRQLLEPEATDKKAKTKKGLSPAANPNAIRHLEQLQVGALVQHPSLGRGAVVAVSAADVDINFAGTIRKLSTEICLAQGLLEPA